MRYGHDARCWMPTSSAEPSARPAPHLVAEGLEAGYGSTPVISDVSICVGKGEVVVIIGPNGAGKSTLLKAIVGVIRASRGSVTLDGEAITNLPTDALARKGVGYVPQTKDVFDPLTVAENLRMGGYLVPKQLLASRMDEVMTIFPMLPKLLKRTASKLSGGERKMVAIARILMLKPSIVILDEPTSSLSVDLAAAFFDTHIRRLADGAAAVVMVEQKAKAALECADWAYLLVSGTTQISGPAATLLADPAIGELFLGRSVDGLTDRTSSSSG